MAKTRLMQDFLDTFRDSVGLSAPQGCCVCCKQPFTDANVFTELGWKETRISQTCEKCWNEMFSEAPAGPRDPNEPEEPAF